MDLESNWDGKLGEHSAVAAESDATDAAHLNRQPLNLASTDRKTTIIQSSENEDAVQYLD